MLILASLAAAAATPLRLSADILTARDVATLTTGRDAAILRLPPGMPAVTLAPDALRTLVANRLPGVPFALRNSAAVRVLRGAATARPRSVCYRVRAAIPAGAALDATMVEQGSCVGAVTRLAYDTILNVPVAQRDVAPGANLGKVRIPADAPLRAGSALMLRTRAGRVTIEQPVISLQPARAGARVFVRAPDGTVFASRIAAR